MELTIKNISLFLGENLDYIDKGYIIIKNGRIENVGSGDNKGSSNENTYEGKGILVMPGFVNAHTHIGDSIGKDIGVDSTFDSRIHPIHGITVHPFSQHFRLHAKASTEHFRQYNNLCFFIIGQNFILQHLKVGGFVFPMKFRLYECDSEC